jgi:exonuclease SbcD
MTVRFVHTGDLHLDSPFAGLSTRAPSHVAPALREATIWAWAAVVDLAIQERVDFVLVAGDVFDQEERSLLAQVRFRDGLERLAEAHIPALVVAGNHDPGPSWERAIQVRWPAQARLFESDEVTSWSVRRSSQQRGAHLGQRSDEDPQEEIARVYGLSFGRAGVRENLARRFRREPDAPLAIGLLHANVGPNTGHDPYAPCSLDDLRRADMDYWALGHVHRRSVVSAASPVAVYCGNPQGRDPKEADPRGCYLVTASSDGRIVPEFRPVDVVRWQHLTIEASDLDSLEPLIDRVVETVDGALVAAGRSIVARVTIAGCGPLHTSLVRSDTVDQIREEAQARLGMRTPWAWIESLRNHTRPALDLEARAAAPDFLGEVLRELRRLRAALAASGEIGVSEVSDLLDETLGVLFSRGRGRRFLHEARPDGQRLLDSLDEAERILLDRLAEGD